MSGRYFAVVDSDQLVTQYGRMVSPFNQVVEMLQLSREETLKEISELTFNLLNSHARHQ